MDQMNRQTETREIRPEGNSAKRIVGVIFGVIEIILGLRFIFKLLGANPDNGFVRVIYNITQFFVGIFEGIFSEVTLGSGGNAVFEPATLIAIVIVALIAWLIMKLMIPRISNRVERTEYREPSIQQNPNNNQQQNPNNIQNPNTVQQNPNTVQQNPNTVQQNPDNIQQDPDQRNRGD